MEVLFCFCGGAGVGWEHNHYVSAEVEEENDDRKNVASTIFSSTFEKYK